ncbi:FliH/SctL family protein [Oscillospiraceae bacterium PP1C4]
MLKIIKPDDMVKSDEVVLIPDAEKEEKLDAVYNVQEKLQLDPAALQKVYEEMFLKTKQESEQIAQGILNLARSQRDTILKQARDEADSIREQYRQEGYQSGALEKTQQIDASLHEVKQGLEELREEHRQFMDLYTKKLEEFALDIASAVMQKRISEDALEMAELVKHAVSSVRGADWISVELSEKLRSLVSFLEVELKKDPVGHIDIAAKDIPIDSCMIQTSDGMIDASISTQLNNLKDYFNQFE